MDLYTKINFLLGTDRKQLPKLIVMFLLASVVEVIGIGMIAPFIASLSNPDIIAIMVEKYFFWIIFVFEGYTAVSVMAFIISFFESKPLQSTSIEANN